MTCRSILKKDLSHIGAVVAESFGRRFFRDGLKEGIRLLKVMNVVEKVHQGDELEIGFEEGLVKNLSTREEFQALPLSVQLNLAARPTFNS